MPGFVDPTTSPDATKETRFDFDRTDRPAGAGAALVSLAFWVTLIVAGCLYAAVALSPKLADWIRVRQMFVANAARLDQLEQQADRSEQLLAAVQRDTRVAVNIAELDSRIRAEAQAAVPETADAGVEPRSAGLLLRSGVVQVVEQLAGDLPLRRRLLIMSGVLTLFAFTFLHEGGFRAPRLLRWWKSELQ